MGRDATVYYNCKSHSQTTSRDVGCVDVGCVEGVIGHHYFVWSVLIERSATTSSAWTQPFLSRGRRVFLTSSSFLKDAIDVGHVGFKDLSQPTTLVYHIGLRDTRVDRPHPIQTFTLLHVNFPTPPMAMATAAFSRGAIDMLCM